MAIVRNNVPCFHAPAVLPSLVLAAIVLLRPFPAAAFDGPLQVRNQFPTLLPTAPPYLESAGLRDQVLLGLSHSSVYVTEASSGWLVMMDMELTELSLRLRTRIGSRTEVGCDVPVLRPSEGSLDGPLADLHDSLGTGDYGRHERPENAFLYVINRGGSPVVRGVSDRTGLGDVRMTVREQLRDAHPRVSVRADIEAPTGDARTGYGNGSWDFGLALLMDTDLSASYRMTVNLGGVVPGDLKGYQQVPLRSFGYAGIAFEAAWWERLHAIGQLMVQTSPYPVTGIRQVDWPGILLTVGGRYSFGRNAIELSLTEDPNTAGAPDFIVNMTIAIAF